MLCKQFNVTKLWLLFKPFLVCLKMYFLQFLYIYIYIPNKYLKKTQASGMKEAKGK